MVAPAGAFLSRLYSKSLRLRSVAVAVNASLSPSSIVWSRMELSLSSKSGTSKILPWSYWSWMLTPFSFFCSGVNAVAV